MWNVKPVRRVVSLALALVMGSLLAMLAPSPARAAGAAKPQTYFFLVFSDPAPGTSDAVFNRCYNEIHGPDVTSIPGFTGAQRFEYADQQLRAVALHKPRYLILYTVVTADPAAVRADIEGRMKSGRTRTCALANVKMYTYRAFRPLEKGVGGEPADAKRGGLVDTYEQIVFGNAVKGMDAAFNRWYDGVHEPQMLKVPGFTAAQRAVLSPVQLAPTDEGPTRSRYLALFTIRTTDLGAVLRAANRDGTEPIPAFDRQRTWGYTYKAIGPFMDGERIRAQRARRQRAAPRP